MENKIKINGKEYTLEVEKTDYGDFYIGYWNGNDEVAETETGYLISGPGDLEETIEKLKEKLNENEIKPGIDNKQYLWSELSEEEKQKLLEECEEIGRKIKEKYPSPSLEAHKYWRSLAPRYCRSLGYFKKYCYDRKNN